MHNWYTIEVEAEDRRQAWERAAAADSRAAQADRNGSPRSWLRLPRFSRPSVTSHALPRLALSGPVASTRSPEPCC